MAHDQEHYELAYREVQRHLEDSETSKLAHWYAASVYERRHRLLIGIPATVLALVLTWLLSASINRVFSDEFLPYFRDTLPVILSLAVSILSGLGAVLNLNDVALRHRMAAQNYHNLWRHCLNWKTDFPDVALVKEAVHVVRQYRDRLNEINNNSPQIPRWAWRNTQAQRLEGSTSYRLDDTAKPGSGLNSGRPKCGAAMS
ncbi:MAG: SLATT domain-containing protein [bacterium]